MLGSVGCIALLKFGTALDFHEVPCGGLSHVLHSHDQYNDFLYISILGHANNLEQQEEKKSVWFISETTEKNPHAIPNIKFLPSNNLYYLLPKLMNNNHKACFTVLSFTCLYYWLGFNWAVIFRQWASWAVRREVKFEGDGINASLGSKSLHLNRVTLKQTLPLVSE